MAAILIANRPPQPPAVEYESHKKLIGAFAKARKEIPPIPMDKTVDYILRELNRPPEEQNDLHQQFEGKPEALLSHITAAWTGQRREESAQ